MKTEDNKRKSPNAPGDRRRRERRCVESPGYAKVTSVGWYCRRFKNRRKEGADSPAAST